MFYNVPLFSLKLEFCRKLTASLLLILLIIQRESTPQIFKIAISLRFIDIMAPIADIPFIQKILIVAINTFFEALVLLRLIPSEMLILS